MSRNVRWLLVIPVAVLGGLVSESLGRLFISCVEILHNSRFLYRPFTDEFIWQAWAAAWFVWAGTKVAPSNRFQTSSVLAAFKVAVALYNSFGLLQYVHGGGSWADLSEETQAPVWWRLCVEIIAMVAVIVITLRERGRRPVPLGLRSQVNAGDAIRPLVVWRAAGLGWTRPCSPERQRRVSQCPNGASQMELGVHRFAIQLRPTCQHHCFSCNAIATGILDTGLF